MRIIAGEARGRPIRAPRGRGTRPALDQMRESIFSILGTAVEDSAVEDLFAGAGAFGLEAISRGARSATFVERDPQALLALERNIEELGFSGRSKVVKGDALRDVEKGARYDLIFMDPPFASFDSPAEASAVLGRLSRLLESGLEPGGTLLLRVPTRWTPDLPRPPADRRAFGASTALFFGNP